MSDVHGSIVLYRILPRTDKLTMNRFVKKLYGYEDKSNYGRYVYRREGILDRIPHVRLIRGALIVRKVDEAQLVDFMERFGAEVHVREVILTSQDRKALGL
ncbi:MAG: hypothetical protein ACE5QF_07465 [Thermoplasmata archaeon]